MNCWYPFKMRCFESFFACSAQVMLVIWHMLFAIWKSIFTSHFSGLTLQHSTRCWRPDPYQFNSPRHCQSMHFLGTLLSNPHNPSAISPDASMFWKLLYKLPTIFTTHLSSRGERIRHFNLTRRFQRQVHGTTRGLKFRRKQNVIRLRERKW